MKIIFLDMDGVMNSHQSIHFFHDFLRMENNWFQKYMPDDMEKFRNYEDEICPMAVSNMRTLLNNHPDTRFVISSTWRRGRDISWFNKLFKHIGITGDSHCFACDGVGHYTNGKTCSRCKGSGVKKCPLNDEDPVIDRTPVINGEQRGTEIQAWFDSNSSKYDIEQYVILDDDSDMCDFLGTSHFIQTDGRVGFDYIKMEEVDKLFDGFIYSIKDVKPGIPYRMFSKPRDSVYYYDDTKNQFYFYDKDGKKVDDIFFYHGEFFAEVKDGN